MSAAAASKAVERFLAREFGGLRSHIRRFGPLPPPTSFQSVPNPFLPWRNPKNGKWSEPKYSLRRQAELVKKAKISGMLCQLPPGPKTPTNIPKPVRVLEAPFNWVAGPGREGSEAAREKKMLEKPGAELGTQLYAGKKRMFKGHKWERVKAHRERRQSILMRDMAKRVFNYKNYYKKRRPNPLKPPRTTKAPKLPF